MIGKKKLNQLTALDTVATLRECLRRTRKVRPTAVSTCTWAHKAEEYAGV